MKRFVACLLLTCVVSVAVAQEPATKNEKPDQAAKSRAKKDAKPEEAKPEEAQELKQEPQDVMAAPQISLRLKDNLTFVGAAAELDKLTISTVFGEIEVPLTTIAGIRFASEANERTTIAMLNGDSITGAVDLSAVKVNTQWGQASVHVHALESMTMVPDMSWVSESAPGGIRWKLTRITNSSSATSTLPPPIRSTIRSSVGQ